MSTNSSPFNFPIDILRCIVEFAVWNDTKTAQNLELVNHAFRIWAGPAVYRTVLLCSPSTLIGFSELVRAAPVPSSTHATAITRDTDFYKKNVRYLGISKPKVPESVLDPIFLVCTGVITLEVEGVQYKGFEGCAIRPRELILPTNYMSMLPPSMLENLTHLWSYVPFYPKAANLPPRLQRLAVVFSVDVRPDLKWLSEVRAFTQLQLIVLNFRPTRSSRRFVPSLRNIWDHLLSEIHDERVVIRNSLLFASETEPRLALRNGVSVWELALQDGERHPDFVDTKLTLANPGGSCNLFLYS